MDSLVIGLVNGGHCFGSRRKFVQILKMGVDIATYRARIGQFCMPRKTRNRLETICLCRSTVSCLLRWTLFLSLLLILGGDVETNPGPPKAQRQKTLQFSDALASPSSTPPLPRSKRNQENQESEIMAFLGEMKADLKSDMNTLNNKIDGIEQNVNELRSENERLSVENRKLRTELDKISVKLDSLEAHSRRNNLRFYGLRGNGKETWAESEQRVRDFIVGTMNMEDYEQVEIERAHRLGSIHSPSRPIIVKFSRYKDKESILLKARELFNADSEFSVKEDFTERIQKHRRELGKRLMEERAKGKSARLKYDKLIIGRQVYRYDERTNKIICQEGQHEQVHVNGENQRCDETSNDQSSSDRVTQSGAVGGEF